MRVILICLRSGDGLLSVKACIDVVMTGMNSIP